MPKPKSRRVRITWAARLNGDGAYGFESVAAHYERRRTNGCRRPAVCRCRKADVGGRMATVDDDDAANALGEAAAAHG